MAGSDPAIDVFARNKIKTWMPGTWPGYEGFATGLKSGSPG
jgi:hypothetical protein